MWLPAKFLLGLSHLSFRADHAAVSAKTVTSAPTFAGTIAGTALATFHLSAVNSISDMPESFVPSTVMPTQAPIGNKGDDWVDQLGDYEPGISTVRPTQAVSEGEGTNGTTVIDITFAPLDADFESGDDSTMHPSETANPQLQHDTISPSIDGEDSSATPYATVDPSQDGSTIFPSQPTSASEVVEEDGSQGSVSPSSSASLGSSLDATVTPSLDDSFAPSDSDVHAQQQPPEEAVLAQERTIGPTLIVIDSMEDLDFDFLMGTAVPSVASSDAATISAETSAPSKQVYVSATRESGLDEEGTELALTDADCNELNPCPKCAGDCDSDAECMEGYQCYFR